VGQAHCSTGQHDVYESKKAEERVDNILERRIEINYEPEYKGLYQWCINEFDANNEKISNDLIPWYWSFYFSGSSFTVVRSVSIEEETKDNGDIKNVTKSSTKIVGTLHSGWYPLDGNRLVDEVSFSMFGTARSIKEFELFIYQVDTDDLEACTLTAIPSYESEIDFHKEVIEDYVMFEVMLNKDRFGELVRLLDHKLVDRVGLRLSQVSGVYSEWSPLISTSFAKILSKYHKVKGVKKSKFEPLLDGRVGKFNLSFVSQNPLLPKQSLQSLNFEKAFDEPKKEERSDKPDLPTVNNKYGEDSFLHSIAPAVKLMRSLKIALWCIFAALMLLLMK
jgi:hypothetical protein